MAALAFALVWGAVRMAAPDGGGPAAPAAGAVAALAVLGIWLGLRLLLLAPVRRLARGLRAVRESRSAEAGLGA
ncbi:MAG: hypothetical protein KDI38_27345, partial [Calditrichaeota bacterium]|nr:hypothetical protein [Calditrichota bacterium]